MGRFEIKMVGLLLLMTACVFVISVVLVDDMLQVSGATLRGHAQELQTELRETAPVYRELVRTKKKLYEGITAQFAVSPELTYAVWSRDKVELRRAMKRFMTRHPELRRLAVRNSGEELQAVRGRSGAPGTRYRLVKPIGRTGWTLIAGFRISRALLERFQKIGRMLDVEAPHLKRINRALQPRYLPTFVRLFGVALLIVAVVGWVFARRMARRVTRLSRATRKVAEGDLDVTVEAGARDEVGQLSSAFNDMVGELRRSRAQIAYLQKISAWQDVARRLAHEIKNPLTPILLAIQQVQQKYDGRDDKFQKLIDVAAEIVKEEIEGLRRLVEAFSAFAKLPQVQPEAEDISTVMEDFRRGMGSLEDLGELDWHPPSPSFRVQVDRQLFRRVLFNLVENAFQAAREEGTEPKVVVRARKLPRSGVGILTLTDNGPGVEEEIRDQVFDPYFTTKDAGTGLGLAIVKKIVLEHGGSIDVESAPDGGARFTIRLPVA